MKKISFILMLGLVLVSCKNKSKKPYTGVNDSANISADGGGTLEPPRVIVVDEVTLDSLSKEEFSTEDIDKLQTQTWCQKSVTVDELGCEFDKKTQVIVTVKNGEITALKKLYSYSARDPKKLVMIETDLSMEEFQCSWLENSSEKTYELEQVGEEKFFDYWVSESSERGELGFTLVNNELILVRDDTDNEEGAAKFKLCE